MSDIWRKQILHWKEPRSWTGTLSRWLRPYLNRRGIRYLQRLGEQDLCWDDSEWLQRAQTILEFGVDHVTEKLGAALGRATIRMYHGCRPKDAGSYLRGGILLNNPRVLANELRDIVAEEKSLHYLEDVVEKRLEDFDARNRDVGRLYLALDDRTLINRSGHYLLYGSEWILCALGLEGHATLLQRGIPTVLLVDLPLSRVTQHQRREFASALLQEWTRIKINKPNWVPERDFTFILRQHVSAALVVGHYHPEAVRDPFHHRLVRHIYPRRCPSCGEQTTTDGERDRSQLLSN